MQGCCCYARSKQRTGLVAGLAEWNFRDHRDPRLIEHTRRGVVGVSAHLRTLSVGYEDLNDHDQLRTDPMLAVAVDKADPLGERQAAGLRSGEALARAGVLLNRLELTGAEVDEQERYKKIAMDPDRIDGWMVDAFVESHESAPEEMVLDLDAVPTTRSMKPAGRPLLSRLLPPLLLSPAVHLSRGSIGLRPVAVFQYLGPRDRWRNWNGSSAGWRHSSWPEVSIVIRAALGLLPG